MDTAVRVGLSAHVSDGSEKTETLNKIMSVCSIYETVTKCKHMTGKKNLNEVK